MRSNRQLVKLSHANDMELTMTCSIDDHSAPPKHAAVSPAEKSLGPGKTFSSKAPLAMPFSSEKATSQGGGGYHLIPPRLRFFFVPALSPTNREPLSTWSDARGGTSFSSSEAALLLQEMEAACPWVSSDRGGAFSSARRTERRVIAFGSTLSFLITFVVGSGRNSSRGSNGGGGGGGSGLFQGSVCTRVCTHEGGAWSGKRHAELNLFRMLLKFAVQIWLN